MAQAINEANGETTGVGSCEAGTDGAGAAGADTIQLSGAITLSALLPEITSDVTISGGTGYHAYLISFASSIRSTGAMLATAAGSRLTVENVTFYSGGGGNPPQAALDLGDSATLTNVSIKNSGVVAIWGRGENATYTFDNIYIAGTGKTWSLPNSIFAQAGTWTVTDLAVEAMTGGSSMIRVDEGATLTLKGCEHLNRVMNKTVIGGGSFTDSRSGACSTASGAHGNTQTLTYYAPVVPTTFLPCGLPDLSQTGSYLIVPDGTGLLEYTLTADCVLVNPIFIPSNVRVSVKSAVGARYSITSPVNQAAFNLAGELTLKNVDLIGQSGTRAFVIIDASPPGKLIIEDSVIRAESKASLRIGIIIRAIEATLTRVTFSDHQHQVASLGSALLVSGPGKVTVTDSTFRDNSGGPGAIATYHDRAYVRLLGSTVFSGNSPLDIYDPDGVVCRGSACFPAPPVERSVSDSRSSRAVSEVVVATPTPGVSTCLSLPASIQVTVHSQSTQCQRVDAAGIANPNIRAGDFVDAVDVWGWVLPNTQICFEAAGSGFKFIDTAPIPRTVHDLKAYSLNGMTCATIDRAGIIVLLPGDPPPAAAARIGSGSLSGCMVTTTEIVNFRETPGGGLVIVDWIPNSLLPRDATLTALERTSDWFKVDYYGLQGWVSADYVTTRGDCG